MTNEAAPAEGVVSYVSADRPIERSDQDRLHRSRFAERLAEIIRRWQHRESLVIGLFGPWGSGKSSVKNLVLEALKDEKHLEVIEFNPWQWSGHEQLTTAYFKEIQQKLGMKDTSEEAKKAALLMKAYSASLGLTKDLMEGLPALAQLGLALSVMVGVSPSVFTGLSKYSEIFGIVGIAGILITAFLSRSQLILDAAPRRKEAFAEQQKKTFFELKRELSKSLQRLNHTFLVIIDDIDRLTHPEIREVFQLVKANGDFPNFVYLLPFQRSAAVALKDIHDETGEAFLEKIIQVPFDIPVPDQRAIDGVLGEKLESILASELKAGRFDKDRWNALFIDGLRPYFPDLRSVNRFAASLAFYTELFRADDLLEVNAVDLVALEVLRVFEPRLYRRLASSKGLLTGPESSVSKERQALGEEIGHLLEEVDEPKRERVNAILKQLFPNRGWAFQGLHYGSDFDEGWRKNLQICCDDFYDRYFQLAIGPDAISQSEMSRILAATGSAEKLERLLSELVRQGRIMALIDMLEARRDEVPMADLPIVVAALCSVAEYVPDQEPGFLSISPFITVTRVARRLLFRVESTDERTEILKQVIAAAKGVSATVAMVASEQRRQEKRTGEDALVTPDQLSALIAACLERIRAAAQDGSLIRQKELAHILYRWIHRGRDGQGCQRP